MGEPCEINIEDEFREEMESCSKADILEELLVCAMKNMKVDSQTEKIEQQVLAEHIETSKLMYHDVLEVNAVEEEINETCETLEQEFANHDTVTTEHNSSCHDKPIFDGDQITFGTSILLVMSFAVRYSLSGVAIANLLVLISLHCAVTNLCKSSMTAFKLFFHNLCAPVSLHKYCSNCLMLIEDKELTKNYPNTFCNRELSGQASVCHFLTMAISFSIREAV